MTRSVLRVPVVLIVLAVLAAATSCSSEKEPSAESKTEVITNYGAGVYATYEKSWSSAVAMGEAIDELVAKPDDQTLAVARDAWLYARDYYAPTEAFRFYGGPIDDVETGLEGRINAWPLDEGYIDYVDGNPNSGIINDPQTYPTIDTDLVVELNEKGGEVNISTGWHAIEFLLWGQDLSDDGPGQRPATDYSTAPNAERRATYLTVTTQLLIDDLRQLVDAWAPDADNYRADFEALDPDEALTRIITGVGELSRGELASERLNVAYSERSQENEQSCFSDNTNRDIVGDQWGIDRVITGTYTDEVSGLGIVDLVQEVDPNQAQELRNSLSGTLTAVTSLPEPLDQSLKTGVSDEDPGRVAILNAIDSLEAQADAIAAAASTIGVTISVS